MLVMIKMISIVIAFAGLSSCGNWMVPDTLVGTWAASADSITVRTKIQGEGFQFYHDTGSISIQIHADKTVSGQIGAAGFDHGVIVKNSGNPERTGIAYIIQCGAIGTIFPCDPLKQKEVEIWLKPINGTMEAELRYTDGWAVMPMGDFVFSKKE